MSDEDRTQLDLAAYATLVELWRQENPIKTTKLQTLLAVNAGLIAVATLNGGMAEINAMVFVCGLLFSGVWTLSIARTVLSQQAWKVKITEISARHPGDPRFLVLDTEAAEQRVPRWLRVLGGVSSKYYLVASPLLLCVGWLIALAKLATR